MSDEEASKTPPAPRRRPQQARSREMVRAIEEACEKILREEGPDALNTNRIAEVAGVTISSLYRYFPNKESILGEVYESRMKTLAEDWEALYARSNELEGMSLEQILRLTVDSNADMHVRLLEIHPEFYRQHQKQLDAGDRTSALFDRRWIEQTQRWLKGVLERHRDALGVDDLELAAFIALRTIAGVLRAAAQDAPERLTQETFRAELHRLVHQYLSP